MFLYSPSPPYVDLHGEFELNLLKSRRNYSKIFTKHKPLMNVRFYCINLTSTYLVLILEFVIHSTCKSLTKIFENFQHFSTFIFQYNQIRDNDFFSCSFSIIGSRFWYFQNIWTVNYLFAFLYKHFVTL